MTLNVEFLRKWADELESGKYQQGKAALHYVERSPDKALCSEDGVHKFCCLGVAMVILADEGIVPPMQFNEWSGGYHHDDPISAIAKNVTYENLSKTAAKYIGFEECGGLGCVEGRTKPLPFDTTRKFFTLSNANDSGVNFEGIAKALRILADEAEGLV